MSLKMLAYVTKDEPVSVPFNVTTDDTVYISIDVINNVP